MKGRQLKKPGIRKLARGVKETLCWVGTGGYTRHSRVYYSAAPYPLSDYLPDLSPMKLGDISGELSNRMLKDKLFHYFMAKHLRTPEILASVEKGKLYPHAESAGVSDPKISDLKTLADYCDTSLGVILKQSGGCAGMGVVDLDVERAGGKSTARRQAPTRWKRLSPIWTTTS